MWQKKISSEKNPPGRIMVTKPRNQIPNAPGPAPRMRAYRPTNVKVASRTMEHKEKSITSNKNRVMTPEEWKRHKRIMKMKAQRGHFKSVRN